MSIFFVASNSINEQALLSCKEENYHEFKEKKQAAFSDSL
jgi:hypothetical protein